MKTTTGRKDLNKKERHFQEKHNLKRDKSIQESSRDRGDSNREKIGFVLEGGV